MGNKNILILTSLYPSTDIKVINGTSVCHYFAKEWKKQGHNVKVVYNYNNYPRILYPFLKLGKRWLETNSDDAVLTDRLSTSICYNIEGIDVFRIPIYKRPKSSFSKKILTQQFQTIVEFLESINFKPDLVLGHFIHPNLELSVMLGEYYKAISSVTLHGQILNYSDEDRLWFDRLSKIGFRSEPIRLSFERFYGVTTKGFHCPSGVPSSYIIDNHKDFNNDILSCLYVGNLMKRKHPVTLIKALVNMADKTKYTLTYVGSGGESAEINKIMVRHDLNNVYLEGRISREKVVEEMDKAKCFIMLSERETFGLVYLEAMARGCIVIASRNEGMEGIIKDGENGFLCEAGNENELAQVLLNISSMSTFEKIRISSNALKTANLYTDQRVASNYLRAVMD